LNRNLHLVKVFKWINLNNYKIILNNKNLHLAKVFLWILSKNSNKAPLAVDSRCNKINLLSPNNKVRYLSLSKNLHHLVKAFRCPNK
jgi:hypothetical protein